MFQSERPQSRIEFAGPMEKLVHHHSTSPSCDRLNTTFTRTVLVVSSTSAVGDCLLMQFEVLEELFETERMIIRSKVFQLLAMEFSKAFESVLPFQRFTSS